MDRISALRNVETALAEYEAGERDLESLERRVRAVVRTYATEFEGDLAAYRASGDTAADGLGMAYLRGTVSAKRLSHRSHFQ